MQLRTVKLLLTRAACPSSLYILGIFIWGLLAHTHFFHLTETISLQGFSVLEYMEHKLHPENFSRDFPGGIFATGVSIITLLYVPLHLLLGWSGITLLTIMIGLEIAFVMAGAYVLWETLATFLESRIELRQSRLQLWIYGWLCAILLLSKLYSPDLANFDFPYFHGQFYGFADGIRMAAIAFALSRRWKFAAAFLCFGFMIHPIKTCFAALFILAIAIVDRRNAFTFKNIITGSVCAALAAVWAYFMLLQSANAGITPIASEEFIALTRVFQYHWYPLDAGIYSRYHDIVLSPFLALMTMTALALAQSNIAARIKKQLCAAYALMAFLSVIGIWISAEINSSRLIMLCLMRASELMTLLAPFIILLGFWEKYRKAQWHWVTIYSVFLFSGFVGTVYMSPLFTAVATALYFYEERKTRVLFHSAAKLDYIALAFAIASVAASFYLWNMFPERVNIFTFLRRNIFCSLIFWALLIAISYAKPVKKLTVNKDSVRILLITAGIAIFAAIGPVSMQRNPADYTQRAQAFLNVQLWAKNHTSNSALFMVDPCQNYGWRDFSSRSSIGTPREWYMTAWAYLPDGQVLDKGKKIGNALGLDINQFISARNQPVSANSSKVCAKAQELFYNLSRNAIKRLTKEFDINYYVMLKDKGAGIRQNLKTIPLFENDYYLVFSAKDLNE